MEGEFNNNIEMTLWDDTKDTVGFLDIIDSNVYVKTFVIYYVNGDTEHIFGSILNEGDTKFSFEAITNKDEIDYINAEIDRVIQEVNNEE